MLWRIKPLAIKCPLTYNPYLFTYPTFHYVFTFSLHILLSLCCTIVSFVYVVRYSLSCIICCDKLSFKIKIFYNNPTLYSCLSICVRDSSYLECYMFYMSFFVAITSSLIICDTYLSASMMYAFYSVRLYLHYLYHLTLKHSSHAPHKGRGICSWTGGQRRTPRLSAC